jgi:pimeloyl-ACP methyl ester carboxylesterase
MRTTSARTTWGALPSPLALSATTRSRNPALRGLLPSITTPAQIIAGRGTTWCRGAWSNNEYLADLLPNSEIHLLEAGHFAWEQASDEYGRLILEWVTGGFQRLGGAVTA